MKKDIHPKVKACSVKCTGCGNEFETLSIKESIIVSICNACHPFFTGSKKMLDTEGRVEAFKRKYGNATAMAAAAPAVKKKSKIK